MNFTRHLTGRITRSKTIYEKNTVNCPSPYVFGRMALETLKDLYRVGATNKKLTKPASNINIAAL